MFEEMISLHQNTSRLNKKYITNIENDQIENLLFRYLILRQSLWEIIGKYRDYNTLTDDPETNMKAFVIGYYAALTLYKASGHLITINMKDDQLVGKLNESYFRSGIPKNTFEKILIASPIRRIWKIWILPGSFILGSSIDQDPH
jgi:hypothetical protein